MGNDMEQLLSLVYDEFDDPLLPALLEQLELDQPQLTPLIQTILQNIDDPEYQGRIAMALRHLPQCQTVEDVCQMLE